MTDLIAKPAPSFGALTTIDKPKYQHIRVSSLGSQDIRFNAKDGYGCFSIDGKEDRNRKEIQMQILHIEVIDCKDFYLFNEDFKKYDRQAEVLFLDGDKKLSSLFIKTESLDNLLKLLRQMEMNQARFQFQNVIAKAVEKEGKFGKYHVIDFDTMEEVSEEIITEVVTLFEEDTDILMIASRFHSGQVKMIPREPVNES